MTIYLNKKKVPVRIFSGGEIDVNVSGLVAPHGIDKRIKAIIRNANDLIALMLTVDAIRQIDPEAKISAHIPYLPYARQDRVCNPGEAFGAKVIADLINSIELNEIFVNVPHSDVMISMVKHCRVVASSMPLPPLGCCVMCADEGMTRRIGIHACRNVMHATKKRDPETGKITDTTFSDDVSNRDIMVVDDICDGGQTFIELAKLLKERGARNLYLYVTFGIFRNGQEELLKYYETVDCQFDFRQEEWN